MPANSSDIPVSALRQAASRPKVIAAMRDFYAGLDRRIAERAPVCWNKGECCRFGEFGHRLYVTALEVAYYLATVETPDMPQADDPAQPIAPVEATHPAQISGSLQVIGVSQATDIPQVTEDACPHARDGQCHARARRPLGCRMFYCDAAAQHWQGPLTEEMLTDLRRLHHELNVPYFYAEWLTVLKALSSGDPCLLFLPPANS